MTNKQDRRRVYFIEKKFQINFILKFCILVIIGSLLIGILIYLLSQKSTTVVFEHSRAVVKSTADFLLPFLIQTIIVVSIFIAISTIILTLFISHKIAGPLYRLKKALNAIGFGDLLGGLTFSFRRNDQLQDIAESVSEMVIRLRDKICKLKDDWYSFKDNWQSFKNTAPSDLEQNIKELEGRISQIDKDFDYFKV